MHWKAVWDKEPWILSQTALSSSSSSYTQLWHLQKSLNFPHLYNCNPINSALWDFMMIKWDSAYENAWWTLKSSRVSFHFQPLPPFEERHIYSHHPTVRHSTKMDNKYSACVDQVPNLGTLDILCWAILCCGVYPVHCKIFSSMPGQSWQPEMSPDTAKGGTFIPEGQNCPSLKNTCVDNGDIQMKRFIPWL